LSDGGLPARSERDGGLARPQQIEEDVAVRRGSVSERVVEGEPLRADLTAGWKEGRMAEKRRRLLKRTALRLEQNRSHPLFLLSLTAEEIVAVSDISRLSRSGGGKLLGYQRGEVRRHIQDIVAYLNSEDILFPNSLIIAFSSQVRFRTMKATEDGLTAAGTLTIPAHRVPVPRLPPRLNPTRRGGGAGQGRLTRGSA